jgi:hypothetical protein
MKLSRRKALIAARTGIAGLAGASLIAAAHTGDEPSTTEARKPNSPNQKRTVSDKKKRHDKARHKKGPRHRGHRSHNNRRNKKKRKSQNTGIPLETGSVIPEGLITEEGGRLSAHVLLPFEDFTSEAALADAVAEAEKLNLFILPKGAGE